MNKYLRNKKRILVLLFVFCCSVELCWAYGGTVTKFTNANVSEGVLPGAFSVSADQQVNFSQGNLQYQASTNTWRFAENQWDFVGSQNPWYGEASGTIPGSDNLFISSTYSGWIDLFCWGTSGYDNGANCYQPWSTCAVADYYVYGSDSYDLNDQTGQADWGYNAISNGGNAENSGWRTLTKNEWVYLLHTRNTASGKRYAKACVNNVNCLIILPDDWQTSYYHLNGANTNAAFRTNIITVEDWAILEQHGAVLLPASGGRDQQGIGGPGNGGFYWSATHYTSSDPYALSFDDNNFSASYLTWMGGRANGRSVRLVRSKQAVFFGINATPNPAEGGTISGVGNYEFGSLITLTATANEGWLFINWMENGEEVSTQAQYSFTATCNRDLIANFMSVVVNNDESSLTVCDGTVTNECFPVTGWCINQYGKQEYVMPASMLAEMNGSCITSMKCYSSNYSTVSYGSAYFQVFMKEVDSATIAEYQGMDDATIVYEGSLSVSNGELLIKFTTPYCYQGGDLLIGVYNPVKASFQIFNGRFYGITVQDSDICGWDPYSIDNIFGSNGQFWNFLPKTTFTYVDMGGVYNITAIPNPVDGGIASGTGVYAWDETCVLTATANEGYTFVNWTENGEEVSSEADYSFTVISDRILVANFTDSNVNSTEGVLPGAFSVSANQQVNFSQGNLQYQASTNTWRFAQNQWYFVGDENTNISSEYEGWIDLFGWGTSGYDHGAVCYQPWSISGTNSNYYAYGVSNNNLNDQNGKADWGYNAISNGGNREDCGWYTLSYNEWYHLLFSRATNSGIRFAKANVNNVNGVILLPDDWSTDYYSLSNANSVGAGFSNNTISMTQWNVLEQYGAVFLPNAGCRVETSYDVWAEVGNYWTSTRSGSSSAYYVACDPPDANVFRLESHVRSYGRSVRLARPVQTVSFGINATPNPSEGGMVTGEGYYAFGSLVTLTATANEGYSFVNWIENGEEVSADATYTFTVTGERNLLANFSVAEPIETNHWTPNSSFFANNMTLTGVILIDGVEQASDRLELGAFCGEQCRGSQLASYFGPTQRYVVQITIFGEIGDQISFRLYDHETEQELDLASPAPVSFNSDGYGNLLNPYALNFISAFATTQTTPLTEGWNWWSSYIELSGIDGLALMENSLGDHGLLIKSRESGFVESFDYYGSSMWYGTLKTVINEQMYMIRTDAVCEASVTGRPAIAANHPITLNPGWSWIGFPSQQSVSVGSAMSGVTPEGDDVIKGRNGYATYYAGDGNWYGTLNTLEPGQGYMYQSFGQEAKTLVYATGRSESTRANITPEHNVFKPYVGDYAHNMTITAVVELNGDEVRQEGYELAAFVGDECRGSVKLLWIAPLNRYVAFLTVFGEQDETMTFCLTDGTSITMADEQKTFITDGTLGTLTNPCVLRFGNYGVDDHTMPKVSVYPNPVEKGQPICVDLPEVFGKATIEIIDVMGRVVDVPTNIPGVYTVRVTGEQGHTWHGKIVVK